MKVKSVTKNSIFYIIYSTLNVIFPFVTGIYVAHVLLESYIGEIEAARNIVQYFVLFSSLGIPTYALREIAKVRNNQKELNKVFTELVIINTISTSFFLLMYLGVIFTVPAYKTDTPLYLIFGISIVLNYLNISWIYEGLEEFSFICWRNLIFKILCFTLMIIFVRDNSDYYMYAVITVVGVGGNYLLNVVRLQKFVRFSFKEISLKRHMKSIFFLVVVNLAIEIYTLVDVTMLKFLATPESITYYTYGSKIYKIVLHLLNSFTMVIVPRISFLYKNKEYEKFNNLLEKTLTILILFAVPIIVGIYFTSDFLMVGIFGPSYIKSAQVLKILSIMFLISPIGYLLGSRVMLATGGEKKMIIPVAFGAVVNVILNYLLITRYQENGAAFASLLGEFVVAFVYILLSRKHLNFKIDFKNFSKIIIASAAMPLVLLLLVNTNNSSALVLTLKEILLGTITYFTVLFLFNEKNVVHYGKVLMNKIL